MREKRDFFHLKIVNFTVSKHIPCGLSIEYTSYIRYGGRGAPKLGKHVQIFLYHKN